MSFTQVDISVRQRGFEVRVFPLLGELPKDVEPHLPVCQQYRWQLGPNMWSSPTTKSLDPTVVSDLRVCFPGESHGAATSGFASNCPEPEAWTTEASGHNLIMLIKKRLKIIVKIKLQCKKLESTVDSYEEKRYIYMYIYIAFIAL